MGRWCKRKPGPLLVALLVCACGGDEPDDEPAGQPMAAESAAAAPERRAVFSEAEAAGVLRAYGEGAIAINRVAQDVSQSAAILSYARVVAADYGGINQLIDSIATTLGQTPAENALSSRLRAESDSIVAALRLLPAGFNNTFIEEQVKANKQVLMLLDTALIPSARAPQLKNLFEALRPTLAAHLQRSLQILGERQRAAAERGESWESGFTAVTRPALPAESESEPIERQAPPPAPEAPPPDTLRSHTRLAPGVTSQRASVASPENRS